MGVLILTSALTGCETPGQTALLGAGAGAAIGGAATGRGGGALAGAAIGAGTGFVAGSEVQEQRRRAYWAGYRDARLTSRRHRRGYYDEFGRWHWYR
jgi:hypothetical protein